MLTLDFLALVTAPNEESVFAVSEGLAKRWRAHLSAVYLGRAADPIVGDPMMAGPLWAEVVAQTQKVIEADFRKIQDRVVRMESPTEVRCEESFLGTVEETAARQAMHADFTVMQAPKTEFANGAFDGALFGSGRPVLLLPANWTSPAIGKRVAVAWKAKREAARALADAAPFLAQAEQVAVVTVDAQGNGSGAGPGRDIATHLARKGLRVELRNVDGLGRPAEAALLDEVRALDADLLVMGGYGHSRARQFIFGGVTRSITRGNCPVPVLIAH